MKLPMNTPGLLLTSIFLLALAAPSLAERDRGSRNLDSDGDGYITQEEWDAAERRGDSEFDDLDSDGDGRISEDELKNRKRREGRDRVRDRRS